jgi:glyoxylase-like metal-dependent hydrolase (beta-lactamase superfamily II)
MIIITHSHWDHSQAVPFLCQRARKEGKEIEIFASAKAKPHLRDQSYNEVFGTGPYNNIEEEINPLKEGDTIDLSGIKLKIFDVPGHMKDHIAILDEKNKNLFVGDAIGIKVSDDVFVPPFMPPYWDEDAYLNTIEKLKNIDYDTISLAHFGCIHGEEAKDILEESVNTFKKWWRIFEENIEKIDDTPYIIENIMPKVMPISAIEQYPERLVEAIGFWLSQGYKIYKKL